MRRVDPGYIRPEEVQTFVIAVPSGLIGDPSLAARTFQNVAERLSRVPGVAPVGLSSSITMDGERNGNSLEVEGFPRPRDGTTPLRRFKSFAPGYFETMGIPLIAGRSVTWSEIHRRRPVIVISEPIAREIWGRPRQGARRPRSGVLRVGRPMARHRRCDGQRTRRRAGPAAHADRVLAAAE
jgi:hypothetical protein